MSSLVTVYFCDSEALKSLAQLFEKSLKAEREERRILDFMRYSMASPGRIKAPLLVVKGLDSLLTGEYVDPRLALDLLRVCLKKVGRDTLLLIEAKRVDWTPTNRGEVVLDGVRLPVSSIDVEDTLRLQEEYNIRNFVKASL